MQEDFHYYATYCAAWLAGYSHAESLALCYSAQFVDCCSQTLLSKIKAPAAAATTQLQLELADGRTDLIGLQDITRIWASFHFLPQNLYAKLPHASRRYQDKFRLLCGPNSDLLARTVRQARDGSLQAAGLAMHVLADTWAHRYFAGTPSLVINNTNAYFYELLPEAGGCRERRVSFRHQPGKADDIGKGRYINCPYQSNENSIMNLGHGRAGHLPDYSFMRYRYLPAWGGYAEIVKNNPSDYYHAFCQMIYAMKYLRGRGEEFETGNYDWEAAAPWEAAIREILEKRQLDASKDWKALGERMSGQEIEDFDLGKYQEEYRHAGKGEKDGTFLGKFILAALAQKSMVTNQIFRSGNMLAGFSVDYREKGFRGIKAYKALLDALQGGNK